MTDAKPNHATPGQYTTADTDQNTLLLTAANVPALTYTVDMAGQMIAAQWDADAAGYAPAKADRDALQSSEAALYFTQRGALDLTKWLAIRQTRAAEYAAQMKTESDLEALRIAEIGERPAPLYGVYQTAHRTEWTKDGQVNIDGSDYYQITPNKNEFMPADIITLSAAWESGCGIAGTFHNAPFKKSDGRPCPFPKLIQAGEYWRASYAFSERHNLTAMNEKLMRLYRAHWQASVAVALAPALTLEALLIKTSEVRAFIVDAMQTGESDYEGPILHGLECDTLALISKLPNGKAA